MNIKDLNFFFDILKILVIFAKIRTREPGPVLRNLNVLILFIVDPYLGTWTRTQERPVLVYVLKLPSTGDKKREKTHPIFVLFFAIKITKP